MKILIASLTVLLLLLQVKLWSGAGGLSEVARLDQALERQVAINKEFRQRNDALLAEVEDLKDGLVAVEERARSDLGMIKEGETFYQIIDRSVSESSR